MRLTPSFDELTARLREFMDSCSQGAVASQAFDFEAFALELFALQFTHNTAYRKLCERRDVTPATVVDCSEIPAVPATAFKELDLSCLSSDERTAVFHSSGTTGHRPSRHFHHAQSLALYEASLLSWFLSSAIPRARPAQSHENALWRLAILTPPPFQAPHSSLVHMFDTLRRAFREGDSAFLGRIGTDGRWNLDSKAAVVALSELSNGNHPLLLLGTAFSYVHLLDYLVEQGIRLMLPPGSRVLETGGYKGLSRFVPKTELHELITERLAVQPQEIICEYGMSELSSQAYNRAPRHGPAHSLTTNRNLPFYFPPWARAQIVSPETGQEVSEGETGLLRIIDLANAYSVAAIQTEDLGIHREQGFDLLGRALAAEPRGCSLMAT